MDDLPSMVHHGSLYARQADEARPTTVVHWE